MKHHPEQFNDEISKLKIRVDVMYQRGVMHGIGATIILGIAASFLVLFLFKK